MGAAAKKAKAGAARGLGRGLGALLGDAPVRAAVEDNAANVAATAADNEAKGAGGNDADGSPASKKPLRLPIEFLKPNPEQPRRAFNEDALAELAASIEARGMLQPILVRPRGKNAYEIVAGERRWRAAQQAKLHDVPVVVRELSDEETAEIALIENVQRVDLNPVEEAEAYQRLAEHYKRTQEEIARAVGKSRSHVANLMRLLTLPTKSLNSLKAGDITMGHARAMLGGGHPDALLDQVIKFGLSVRQTEKLVQETSGAARARAGSKKDAGKKPAGDPAPVRSMAKDADTRALENDLAAALGLEVALDHSKKGAGSVTIKYLNLDQLDDVCRRLMGAGV